MPILQIQYIYIYCALQLSSVPSPILFFIEFPYERHPLGKSKFQVNNFSYNI